MTPSTLDLGSLGRLADSGVPVAPAAPSDGSRFSAALYDPFLALGELRGMRSRRRRLLAAAAGRVLEIGAGTGLNLAHYPDSIEELILTEPVEAMARKLEARVRATGRRASVVRAGAADLPVADASIDTVVSTMVLCTVPDPEAALAEMRRVLRPGGRLLFCEHVRGDWGLLERWQRRLAKPWAMWAEGCRCDQPTLELIDRTLRVGEISREKWRGMPALVHPLVIGEAVR